MNATLSRAFSPSPFLSMGSSMEDDMSPRTAASIFPAARSDTSSLGSS